MTIGNQRGLTALLFAASVSICAGCLGQGGAEVEGKLTMDGSPLKDAEVRFVPGGASGRNASAYTDAEGRYKIPAGKDGVAPGRHRVVVTDLQGVADLTAAGAPPPVGEGAPITQAAGARKRRIPAAYGDAMETPLQEVEVKPGKQTLDFDLKAK